MSACDLNLLGLETDDSDSCGNTKRGVFTDASLATGKCDFMEVIVNVPLRATRKYLDDFDESTIPDVGENFNEEYIVSGKVVDGDICTLTLKHDEKWFMKRDL